MVKDRVQVATAARVMRVSRQSIYQRMTPAPQDEPAASQPQPGVGSALRLMAPPLPEQWQVMALGPDHCDVDTAIHVLARRHPAAGYRKVTARARRKGYSLNRKKTARLLKAWGFLRTGRKPHPKAQGKPFDITASNQLWQTDMTSIEACLT